MEYFDKKINGADPSHFQDCFIKVQIVDFFLGAVWNWKKNWKSKSVFLAFTISIEGDGKMIGRYYDLEFEFSERQKVLLEFRNQIGSVLRLNLRISQLNGKNWSRDRSCRISGPLSIHFLVHFLSENNYSIILNSFFVQCSLDPLSMLWTNTNVNQLLSLNKKSVDQKFNSKHML